MLQKEVNLKGISSLDPLLTLGLCLENVKPVN